MHLFAQQFFDFARSVTPGSRFRLAPTPSGYLHMGNALNFILNWLAAKYGGGDASGVSSTKIYLRIDDLDSDRKRPEYLQDVFDTLDWLQLDWERPAIHQSDNIPRYYAVLEALREQKLLFACQKSRRELEQLGGLYPPEFRMQNCALTDENVAWRVQTPPDFPLPDFVVRRRDGIPAYQVASFADDLHFGITHIVRGLDLEASTRAQQYLAQLLSADNFLKIRFLHHPLILGAGGEKLSKSAGADALKAMRATGAGPEMVFQTAGQWLGLEGDSAQTLLRALREKLA